MLSESIEVWPELQERNWSHRWEMLQAEQAELLKGNPQFSTNLMNKARQELHSFYVHAYHLKDALISDGDALGLRRQDIEAAINEKPALALAADLANVEKHRILHRKPRSGYIPKVVSVSAVSFSDRWYLKLAIEHGPDRIDGVQLTAEIIAQWRDVLTSFKLLA